MDSAVYGHANKLFTVKPHKESLCVGFVFDQSVTLTIVNSCIEPFVGQKLYLDPNYYGKNVGVVPVSLKKFLGSWKCSYSEK